MIDTLGLARIGAFVATGMAVLSFMMLLIAILMVAFGSHAGERISLIYLLGTVAGLSLAYMSWEYEQLALARAEAR